MRAFSDGFGQSNDAVMCARAGVRTQPLALIDVVSFDLRMGKFRAWPG